MNNTDKLMKLFEVYNIDISSEKQKLFNEINNSKLSLLRFVEEEKSVKNLLDSINDIDISNISYEELRNILFKINQIKASSNISSVKNPFLDDDINIVTFTNIGECLVLYKNQEYCLDDVLLDDLSDDFKLKLTENLFSIWNRQNKLYLNQTKGNIIKNIDKLHNTRDKAASIRKIHFLKVLILFMMIVFTGIFAWINYTSTSSFVFSDYFIVSLIFVLIYRFISILKINKYYDKHLKKINKFFDKISILYNKNLKLIKRDYKNYNVRNIISIRDEVQIFSIFYLKGSITKFYSNYLSKRKRLKFTYFLALGLICINIFYILK